MKTVREMAVAGSFYPRRCIKLQRLFRDFAQKNTTKQIKLQGKPKAILVPHAGYIYSGRCADSAYRIAAHYRYKRIIILGPSHRIYFKGISASYYETLQTPCKTIAVDTPYLIALAKRFPIGFVPKVHAVEHSTEVQFPFVARYFPDTKAIELIYGDIDTNTLANLIIAIWQNHDTLLVVSSDLSHYYPIEIAKSKDTHCIDAFVQRNPTLLHQGCEACGFKGIEALLLAAAYESSHSYLSCYTTSAEASNDTKRVVGYMSGVVF